MPALSIQPPYPIFTDTDGQPLENGYIWIGTANQNPITNPIAAYWDAALTVTAAQPVRTLNGYPSNAGTPARLYVNSDYSIQVQNKNGTVVYSAPGATERLSADLVTFVQAGSGAVTRTAQAKMRDIVSVKDFGAVGDGVADDTAAIQAACTAAKTVTFGSSADNYRITGTITLTSGATLLMQGATVTQATDQTPIFNAGSTDNVTITGGRFVGKSEASYTNSPSSQAICVKADNATDLLVTENRFENFWYSPLMVSVGGNRVEFSSNTVKGPGAAVLGVDINRRNTIGCTILGSNVRVSNNDIYDTATGIIIGQGSTEIVVDGNVVHDLINEHGIYVDTGIRRLTISNNVIRNTGADGTGMKVQCYDSFGVESQCVAITGNSISNTGGDAIAVINTTGSPTLRTVGVTITGNTIQNAGAYGIDAREVNDCVISGNEITTAASSGIAWRNADNILIIGNVIRSSALTGIRDLSSSTNVTVKDNVVRNCATANDGSDEYGILIGSGGVNHVIDGNIISDANANMRYGIYIIPDINSTLSIIGNTVMQSTDQGLRLGATTALREYRRNNWIGTLGATYNDPVLPVVASAATISLPTAADSVSISGTTNITTINANGHSGRRVTLYFQGALTVVRGSNLTLNQSLGNFVTTAGDTLTLCCDGTTWYEIARSAN
jgi:polygalacturonase